MSNEQDIVQRLRDYGTALECHPLAHGTISHTEKAGAMLRLAAAEIELLRTVMIAAAEEIHAHWDAHCDSEGYGPANLMRRLENGIPVQYGYTAGAFAELRKDAERYRYLRKVALWRHSLSPRSITWDLYMPEPHITKMLFATMTVGDEMAAMDAAIDAARVESDSTGSKA